MPTGYTADIEKGISFEEFALDCVRAFGACVTLRDNPNAEIPEEFKPSTWYQEQLEKAEKDLMSLKKMSEQEWAEMAMADFKTELIKYENSLKKNNELEKKYNKMLAKVKAWQPPTPDHIKFKNFMIRQIESSIKFDCGNKEYYERIRPKLKTPTDWINSKIDNCLKDIGYYSGEQIKENERVADRNKWLKELRNSLKQE